MVKLVNTADLKSAALGLTGASPVGSIISLLLILAHKSKLLIQ